MEGAARTKPGKRKLVNCCLARKGPGPADDFLPSVVNMQIVQTVWYWLLPHWLDVVIAIALAVIVDLLRIGSLLRSVARHIKNKLAEGSAILLRKRIAKLERYRNTLKSYADKSIYLGTLNSIVKVLVLMSFAGILFLMKYAGFLRDGDIGAICAL